MITNSISKKRIRALLIFAIFVCPSLQQAKPVSAFTALVTEKTLQIENSLEDSSQGRHFNFKVAPSDNPDNTFAIIRVSSKPFVVSEFKISVFLDSDMKASEEIIECSFNQRGLCVIGLKSLGNTNQDLYVRVLCIGDCSYELEVTHLNTTKNAVEEDFITTRHRYFGYFIDKTNLEEGPPLTLV